jgi:hypothetical protein
MVDTTDQGTYKLLDKNHFAEDELKSNVAIRVRDALVQLDAGGLFLLEILDNEKKPGPSVLGWSQTL